MGRSGDELPDGAGRRGTRARPPDHAAGRRSSHGHPDRGTSPRLMLDDGYRGFLSLVASQIGTAIAAAQALQEAQARAEALAELDRAKTAFFSNVSHEFRTPLTLMLGPTEEALASPERALRGKDLETVHRNERRLLKLVNTLLDFSRIEAGRVNATLRADGSRRADHRSRQRLPVGDGARRTAADRRLPAAAGAVYVDREMWEKIVLNLLSNAFKFTFQGSIAVERRGGRRARRASRARQRHRHRRERSRPRLRPVPPHRTRGGAHARRIGHRPGARPRARRDPRRQHPRLERRRRRLRLLGSSSARDGASCRGARASPGQPRRRAAPTGLGATPYVEEALRWLPSDTSATCVTHRSAAPASITTEDSGCRRQRRHARLPEPPALGPLSGRIGGRRNRRAGRRAAAAPRRHRQRRHDAGPRRVRAHRGAARRRGHSHDSVHPALSARGRRGAARRAPRRRRRLPGEAVLGAGARRARRGAARSRQDAIARRGECRQAGRACSRTRRWAWPSSRAPNTCSSSPTASISTSSPDGTSWESRVREALPELAGQGIYEILRWRVRSPGSRSSDGRFAPRSSAAATPRGNVLRLRLSAAVR